MLRILLVTTRADSLLALAALLYLLMMDRQFWPRGTSLAPPLMLAVPAGTPGPGASLLAHLRTADGFGS